jgi:hypothetical protein
MQTAASNDQHERLAACGAQLANQLGKCGPVREFFQVISNRLVGQDVKTTEFDTFLRKQFNGTVAESNEVGSGGIWALPATKATARSVPGALHK